MYIVFLSKSTMSPFCFKVKSMNVGTQGVTLANETPALSEERAKTAKLSMNYEGPVFVLAAHDRNAFHSFATASTLDAR